MSAIDAKLLGEAIALHKENEWGDESYDPDTSEVQWFEHSCSAYCADDIARRYEELAKRNR